MSSHYNFQKQQANEQIQARYQEAEAHRMAKEANGGSSFQSSIILIVPALVGLVVVFLLLTGCSPDPGPQADVEAPTNNSKAINMDDRIRFQDKLEAPSFVDNNPPATEANTMADWIQFQDKRDPSLNGPSTSESGAESPMAEKIEFHDRILDQNR